MLRRVNDGYGFWVSESWSVRIATLILSLAMIPTGLIYVAEAAKYGAASRFLIPVSILMASYASVIQPVLTQSIGKLTENSGLYLSKMASYPLILGTLAAIISPFLSRQILTAFFGSNYTDAALTLDIPAVSVVPFCLVMVVARGLVATNSQHIDLIANILGVAGCIYAGLWLIPQYGATGGGARIESVSLRQPPSIDILAGLPKINLKSSSFYSLDVIEYKLKGK